MNNFLKHFLMFFCLSAFLVLPVFIFADEAHNNAVKFEKIFYLPKYNAEEGVKSINKNWKKIDILAPQYHVVNADFTITGAFGPKLKKAIKDYKLKVMPLIANANFNQKIMHNLLVSPLDQDKVINYLVKGALSNGYIGWQFDFENINYKDKDLYSAFVQKAGQKFKENNLVFSVVAVPRITDFEDTSVFKNWSGVYDYKKLAENCDFVSLMAYDDPNSKGPVASLLFVKKVLDYVKDKIPSQKLSLGVPLYYWKWNADTDKKIGSGLFKNILNIAANFRHVLRFDPNLGVSCLSYSYNKNNYEVWFEDQQSFEAKLDVIKDNNLRGFSAWLLGGEDSAIWLSLDNS